VLPAALDLRMTDNARFDHVADLLETMPVDEAVEAIVADSKRRAEYDEKPWLRELDLFLWQDLNAVGVARSIREITRDTAIADRELLRAVTAPTLILGQEGDEIHPIELARLLVELMPNAELVELGSEDELMGRLPELVTRVAAFLAVDG